MKIYQRCNCTNYVSIMNELNTDLSDDLILETCEEIYFLRRWSGNINGNKPL